MKISNSEAMKLIKELDKKKNAIAFSEERKSRISYKEGEEKLPTSYDYDKTRDAIKAIDARIRKIKSALSLANCTVKLDGFGITIGEGLVYLAQLNSEYERLSELGGEEKLSRRITSNGVLEFTECLFDPDRVETDRETLYSEICKLQVAIDKANLTNIIEV